MFEEIATRFVPMFREFRRCDDQFVGTVEVIDNSTRLLDCRGTDFSTRISLGDWDRPEGPIIILILESPHTSEYKGPTPRPAAGDDSGDTGRALRTLLHEACPMHERLPNGRYPLVLLNAVQYQCSLGVKTTLYRDKVFLKCWDAFGRKDFESRLRSLHREDDVVMNCCTAAGPEKSRLREIVEASICRLVGRSTFRIEHPANWTLRHNAAIKKKERPNYGWRSVSRYFRCDEA
jgi:hypothetical protein